MNERVTALLAVFVAELGASSCLAVLLPSSPIFRTTQTLVQVLGQQAIVVFMLSALLAAGCWIAAPKIWRLRQELSSKLKALAWVSLLLTAVAAGVTLLFFQAGSPWSDPAADFEKGTHGLILALLLQAAATLVFYWATVAVCIYIERKRVIQVTPNPKFGRH